MPTRWELHVSSWKDCTKCGLHGVRQNVVFGRGSVPCDVVFVGQAPGRSENVLGTPFIGPAGREMDNIIKDALAATPQVKFALTNLVGCIPLVGGVEKEPDIDSIKACAPRLVEFVSLASPSLIVCVGRLADTHTSPWYKLATKLLDPEGKPIPRVAITHPSAILKAQTSQQGFMRRRCVIAIRDAVEKYVTSPKPAEVPVWDSNSVPF